jgi:formyl-CoA transferase
MLGATVIKIEPFGGEPIRWRSTGETSGQAFLMLNAGKQGVRLNLKHERGRALFLDLVAGADVVVENFAPGVMDRLDLGWETLHAACPSLILASARAYADHPAAQGLRGMDITVQAMTGVVSTTGFPDGEPVKAGPAVADFAAGTHLAVAILAALYQRDRTHAGQHVSVAMQDALLPALTSNIAGLMEAGDSFVERTGNRHGGMAVSPYNIYPAADGWVAILCVRTKHWLDLCRLMGREDLASDPVLATPAGRVEMMDVVDAAVTQWTARLTKNEIVHALQQADIPAAPVRSLTEVIQDPVIRESGMLVDLGEGNRASTVFGSPVRMLDSPVPARGPAPLLGEDTEDVLRRFLGLTDSEFGELRQQNVI